jgi:hypothetical protein
MCRCQELNFKIDWRILGGLNPVEWIISYPYHHIIALSMSFLDVEDVGVSTRICITTGKRIFAEYNHLCRVLNIGHSAKSNYARCQKRTHGKEISAEYRH